MDSPETAAGLSRAQSAETGLLAEDEPRPFELFNAAGRAPVLLLCDHATRFIPRALGGLGLDEACLTRHIAWDIGIAEVTRRLAERLDAPAMLSHFSRLIVDPNRRADNPTLIPEISDGVVVPGNRGLTTGQKEVRLDTFFRPYHAAIADQLDRMLAAGPAAAPVLISMHSFTPVMKGEERPWEIGILWNRDPRLPRPLMDRLRAEGLTVGDNLPYSGADEHGYTQHTHGDARGLANVLIEVRQDLIDTHHGAADWAERLGAALEAVLGDPGLYKVEHYG
ncbi:N-formylglutamate amidohydrolase [Pelagibius litoralis]|uniref:N-formylglutamate amidohydrolase n=2 Tax=Pelagibius litoralis TaxID=374515 RepID=A0A967C3G5_9PROT|nr:N-formylglutamate amidohydrolase [Pelagibius litoralis]